MAGPSVTHPLPAEEWNRIALPFWPDTCFESECDITTATGLMKIHEELVSPFP